MIFDTDILIWVQRGHKKAAALVEKAESRCISIYTYMELLQGAENQKQHEYTHSFLHDFSFTTLSLSENIGHRAAIYIEEYALSSGVRAGDAIIAATAVENDLLLNTGNAKHFKAISDLKLRIFKP